MRRIALLAVLAVAGVTAGVATGHALSDRRGPARLLSFADEPSTTTTTTSSTLTSSTLLPLPSTNSTEPGRPAPTTTTSEPEHRTPVTTVPEPGHPAPSTPVAPRPQPRQLTIGCDSADSDPTVACHFDGVPAETTRLVLLRERSGTSSQPLWSTTDTTVRDHADESAEVGVTYVYRVAAYAGDRLLQTSNPERIRAGGGEPATPAFTMALACRATGADTVRCTWADGPADTVRYRLVRTVDDRRGRVVAETTERSAAEANVPAGPQDYYVHALDGTGKVIAVGHAEVDCCGPGDR